MRRHALGRALLPLCVAVALEGCVHQVQTWPPPLEAGAVVAVSFAQPRALSANGQPLVVKRVEGRVTARRADSLVVRVDRVPGVEGSDRWTGGEIAFALDSTTHVERTYNLSSQTAGVIFSVGVATMTVLLAGSLKN